MIRMYVYEISMSPGITIFNQVKNSTFRVDVIRFHTRSYHGKADLYFVNRDCYKIRFLQCFSPFSRLREKGRGWG